MDHRPNITVLPDMIDAEGILGTAPMYAKQIVLHVPRARLVELLNEAIYSAGRAIERYQESSKNAASPRGEAIASASEAMESHIRQQRRLLQLTVELLPQDETVYEITPEQLGRLIERPWEVPSGDRGYRPHYGIGLPR